MRQLAFTRLARADLAEIASYTRRTWGEARKDGYMSALMERMQRLRIRPLASSSRAEVALGMRAARAGRHVIFFVPDDELVFVVRVLHERANAKARVIRALRAGELL